MPGLALVAEAFLFFTSALAVFFKAGVGLFFFWDAFLATVFLEAFFATVFFAGFTVFLAVTFFFTEVFFLTVAFFFEEVFFLTVTFFFAEAFFLTVTFFFAEVFFLATFFAAFFFVAIAESPILGNSYNEFIREGNSKSFAFYPWLDKNSLNLSTCENKVQHFICPDGIKNRIF
ncbi:MAG: hypothetical protein H8E42_10955 [Nitrospinae bacterium]|nr:hypothetical protein [Nitrospinota bacterium]MBL7019848.1 hypothetical protein [Nitrospinaceae bacterium]